MISNNKISTLINSQVPFFVRNDHQNFVTFLEKYYQYTEQENKVVNKIKNVKTYQDIDLTEDQYAELLYSTFLKYIPKDIIADKKLILKHVKDFYRAKGTEKAIRFLMRILYNKEIDLYYPKQDILKVSDGKWFVQKTLRIKDVTVKKLDGTVVASDNTFYDLEKFISTKIKGNTSNATATVERVERFYEKGYRVDELYLSNIDETFRNGETVFTLFDDVEDTKSITANIYSGRLSAIVVTNGGSGYKIGDPVIFSSNTGSGAKAEISKVASGNIAAISVINGGAGYRVSDLLNITVTDLNDLGSGANAIVSDVIKTGAYHPNSYNIMFSTISLESNTQIGNLIYSNLNSSNVNTSIVNAGQFWKYANTGPASQIYVINSGNNYISTPELSIIPNTSIFSLGILGRMEIKSRGLGYIPGDKIEFINQIGTYGFGAAGNVKNVNISGGITEVEFINVPGQITGGAGYAQEKLPKANVISSTGNGANIVVTAILGGGASMISAQSVLGSIEEIIITDTGSGYITAPIIDLSQSGDGKANANAVIVEGIYAYPGRYLNDDGHISSYNFLEDRDYYQPFSYVIKSDKSLAKYKQTVKNLVHPSGMKLFGEYVYVRDVVETITYLPEELFIDIVKD